MNINESVRDWINYNIPYHEELDGIDLVVGGEDSELVPPFIVCYETGSEVYEQNGVTMYGVTNFEITVELHTVPEDDALGTSYLDDQEMRQSLMHVLSDRAAIGYMESLNEWKVFDIRTSSPTTTANEGRRVTQQILNVTACPA